MAWHGMARGGEVNFSMNNNYINMFNRTGIYLNQLLKKRDFSHSSCSRVLIIS